MNNKDIYVIINGKNIEVKDGFKYENNEICVIANQELYGLNQEKISIEEIIQLYKKEDELANFISNTFTIIIVDKIKNKLICIQDMNGDTVPVYYYKNNQTIISNKLLNIISSCSQEKFKINNKVIPLFLKKGFISNQETLIEKVYKTIPKYNLKINLLGGQCKYVKKRIKHLKIKNTADLYIKEFKKILDVNSKDKKIFTTLSNGYDSNFIYSLLDKNKTIEAFSVGGIVGRDETIQVAYNIRNHNNTNLNVAYVSEETLNNYPDLIYQLEGAVYERGIFLQYELANILKNKNLDNIVLFAGEGADQIFSAEYYNNIFYFHRMLIYVLRKIKNLNFGDDLRNLHFKCGILDETTHL